MSSSSRKDQHVWTEAEVGEHDSPEDCLIIIQGRVYNLTDFAKIHPGGRANIEWQAGNDATEVFKDQGHGPKQLQVLEQYCVGRVGAEISAAPARRPSIVSLPKEPAEYRRRGSVDSLSIRGGGDSVGRRSAESFATSRSSSSSKLITLEDIERHDKPSDAWVAIEGKVYDLTKFAQVHPGGSAIILWQAGMDASKAFREQGHGNSHILALEEYFVGYLNLNSGPKRRRSSLLSSSSDEKHAETLRFLESVRVPPGKQDGDDLDLAVSKSFSTSTDQDSGAEEEEFERPQRDGDAGPTANGDGSSDGDLESSSQSGGFERAESRCATTNWTIEEVGKHDNPSDAWVIIEGRVYDITHFANVHPGGAANITWQAGSDGTDAFLEQGHGADQLAILEKFCIGRIAQPKSQASAFARRRSDASEAASGGHPALRRGSTGTINMKNGAVPGSARRSLLQTHRTASSRNSQLSFGSHSVKLFTMNEVGMHDRESDAWVVIHGRVYDVTEFAKVHPGGSANVFWQAGTDASNVFREQGHGEAHVQKLQEYCIGRLNLSYSSRRSLSGLVATSMAMGSASEDSIAPGGGKMRKGPGGSFISRPPSICESSTTLHEVDDARPELAKSQSHAEVGVAHKHPATAASASASAVDLAAFRRTINADVDAEGHEPSASRAHSQSQAELTQAKREVPITHVSAPSLDLRDVSEGRQSTSFSLQGGSRLGSVKSPQHGSFAARQSSVFIPAQDTTTTKLSFKKKSELFTPAMVQEHDQPDDCFISLRGKVYDLTEFASEHPGGAANILWQAGSNASDVFRDQGHTEVHIKALEKYCVGQLNMSYGSRRRLSQLSASTETVEMKFANGESDTSATPLERESRKLRSSEVLPSSKVLPSSDKLEARSSKPEGSQILPDMARRSSRRSSSAEVPQQGRQSSAKVAPSPAALLLMDPGSPLLPPASMCHCC